MQDNNNILRFTQHTTMVDRNDPTKQYRWDLSQLPHNSLTVCTLPLNGQDITLTDGELLVGVSGGQPVAKTIVGTSHEVIVTNGPGTITLSTPQNIDITSSPTFSSITTTGLATLNSVQSATYNDATGGTTSTINGVNPLTTANTVAADLNQAVKSTSSPVFSGLTLTGLSTNNGLSNILGAQAGVINQITVLSGEATLTVSSSNFTSGGSTGPCVYQQVGNTVTVFWSFGNVTPNNGNNTALISLPVARANFNLTSGIQGMGTLITSAASAGFVGAMLSSLGTQLMSFSWISTNTTNCILFGQFQYVLT
jgi:hypothetical protein